MEQTREQWVTAKLTHLDSLIGLGRATEGQRCEADGLRMEMQECFGRIYPEPRG